MRVERDSFDKRPNISITETQWINDYSKRPTLAEFNNRSNINLDDWNSDWSQRKSLTDYQQLEQEKQDLAERPTQVQLNQAVKAEINKYKDWINPKKRDGLSYKDKEKLGVVDKIYEKWYNERDKELTELKLRVDFSWKKFIDYSKTKSDPRKDKFPPAVYQVWEISLMNNSLPVINPRYVWTNYFNRNYEFGQKNTFSRVFLADEYDFFNDAYNEWRKTIYIVNPY
jgi:hypothetical protein